MSTLTDYPNAWPGWETDVLKAAGLPVTTANIAWLGSWHATEGSNAKNNPLGTTAYAPIPATVGVSTLPGTPGVQNFAETTQKGAAATAAFLHMPNYTSILAALKSGNPLTYTFSNANNGNQTGSPLVSALRKWGSGSFATDVQGNELPGTPTASTSSMAVTAATDVGGAVGGALTGWVGELTGWLTKESKLALAYVFLIALAGGLFVVGLKGLGVPTPKMPAVVPA